MQYQLSLINTVLLPQFQNFTDEYGLIADSSIGDPSGNGILYTAHYAVGLVEKNLINEQEKDRIMNVFENCQRLPGLFMRSPVGQNNYEEQDDLYGLMGAEAKLFPLKSDRKLTQSIYNYGININADQLDNTQTDASKQTINKWILRILNCIPGKNRWVFNTQNPGTFDTDEWIGRMRNFVATVKMASGNNVSLFDWFYWAISMELTRYSSNNNTWILASHSAWACEGFGPLTDWIIGRFQAKLTVKYGDFGKLLGTYFQNPNNPLIGLLDGVIS